ncbi:HNH endonuclease signature motif containing protein [Variovorax fucosicus]|uniref:HNH endonuclease signature motif containing protein n=1 Tax=Variovorax fucosicus TaxID=3053517 RepID=UPI002575CD1C|nr:HNH endonuclease signature motif containing protein [Variovorax sp. J22R193]
MNAPISSLRATRLSARGFTADRKDQVTFEVAARLISYDAATGVLTWRESPRYGIPAGAIAGGKSGRGYVVVSLLGRKFTGHRLAWLLHYGAWPTQVIDHINRDKADNRIANLRDVAQAVNLKNR